MMGDVITRQKAEKKKVVAVPRVIDQVTLELLNSVFSWSVKDVLNNNLYKDKVNQIPETFTSTAEYLNSFKLPLIEETRAEFCSGMESVAQSPACEISSILTDRGHKPPKDLHYKIFIKKITDDVKNPGGHYEPQSGDVFALTNVRPRNVADLINPGQYIVFAFVGIPKNGGPAIPIIPSEELTGPVLQINKKGKRLFATFLMNLTTNMRIWKALNPSPKSSNLGLIGNVLQCDSSGANDECCSLCLSDESCNNVRPLVLSLIRSFRLDEAQTNAVLSSVSMSKCTHQKNNVNLIWGPPGTGKSKTVASLLFALLKLKCTTLTCAPTNIAVLQVAERLVKLVLGSERQHDTYGLGDIVLFGNGKRMKIDEHYELVDVFLHYRVVKLRKCLDPLKGWQYSLKTMISLLENPRDEYNTYLRRGYDSETDTDSETDNGVAKCEANSETETSKNKEKVKEIIKKSLKGNEKKRGKGKEKDENGKGLKEDAVKTATVDLKMTFEEFLKNTFLNLAGRLIFCAKNLYTHLPTSALPLNVAKEMTLLINVLKKLENPREEPCQFAQMVMIKKKELLGILKGLQKRFPQPKIKGMLSDFCLRKACLIFCTASGSIKVCSPVEMVIIDEAAQLKECESAIPLQIPGLRNAVLVGDDRQLPAMVQSEVSGGVDFGRSLFQRLANLGKKKHLLNTQYRMHPTISLFPNNKFYEKSIVDATNVKLRSYTRNFLKGDMYGSYTFINVSTGKEKFSNGRSPRNVEEAAVVHRIIGKLYSYHCNTKNAISVGVISPYKGQVGLLQDKFGKKYGERKGNGFTVNVRSVDGFQGGEEDIIIISTVRSNNNGSVGFLSNHQRTNVDITRARYCLWIVGDGSTLANSGTVWQDIVTDAKTRGCYYNADEVAEFKDATKAAIVGTSRRYTYKIDDGRSLEVAKARWKVVLSDDYEASLGSIIRKETHNQVTEMLKKIAEGWRTSENVVKLTNSGVASELLELYKVEKGMYLAWSTSIQKEESEDIQVIKAWKVVSVSQIPKLVKDLSILFGGYTVDFMNRCKHKSFQGKLVVPMSWSLNPVLSAESLDDPTECLSSQLANISLCDI